MNRKSLEQLIGFALHLRGRLNGTDTQADVSRDTLELSRLAKRLHYLDERYAGLDPEAFPTYFQKARAVMLRVRQLLAPYGLWPSRQENDHGEPVYGAKLYAMAGSQELGPNHGQTHALAVPY